MSDQRKKYLDILGLEPNSNETEINNRYALLCKRAKDDKSIDIDEATLAYENLLALNIEEEGSEERKKVRRLWAKYVGAISIAIIIIATLLMIFLPSIVKKNPDLTISYIGKYYPKNNKDVQDYVQAHYPDIKNILLEEIYIDADENDMGFKEESLSGSGLERLSLLLVAGDLEIIICDDVVYRFIQTYNYLLELDPIFDELEIVIKEKDKIYGIDPHSGDKYFFAVNIKEIDVLADHLYLNHERPMIMCVFNRRDEFENIKKAIDAFFADYKD